MRVQSPVELADPRRTSQSRREGELFVVNGFLWTGLVRLGPSALLLDMLRFGSRIGREDHRGARKGRISIVRWRMLIDGRESWEDRRTTSLAERTRDWMGLIFLEEGERRGILLLFDKGARTALED